MLKSLWANSELTTKTKLDVTSCIFTWLLYAAETCTLKVADKQTSRLRNEMLQANIENQLKGQGVQCQYKVRAAETQLGSQQYRQEKVTVVRTRMQN